MRYNKPVYFQMRKKGEYNLETGNYDGDYTEEVLQFASIMDTRTETIQAVYGKFKQGSQTVILRNPFLDDFENIRIGKKIYGVDYSRKRKTFVVSEKAGGDHNASTVSRLR